jgi:hypothetical protein
VDLQANIGQGFTYQWKKGSKTIVGATNQDFTATAPGSYKVTVTNPTGCSKVSDPAVVTQSCKDGLTSGENLYSQLSVYPNPNDGHFTVDLQLNAETTSAATIEVVNFLGQVIFEKKSSVVNGQLRDDLNIKDELPAGIFLLKVIMKESVFTQQLVVNR